MMFDGLGSSSQHIKSGKINPFKCPVYGQDGKEIQCKRALPKSEQGNPDALYSVTKIFVGGVKEFMSDDDIKNYFGTFGKVVSLEHSLHRDTGRKRGFAFVGFEDEDQ